MERKELKKILDDHKKWIENDGIGERADLRRANLLRVDLWGADLRSANLRGADLDFSCWPLWCGSFDVKADDKLVGQLFYHWCKLDVSHCSPYVRYLHRTISTSNKFLANIFAKTRSDVYEL